MTSLTLILADPLIPQSDQADQGFIDINIHDFAFFHASEYNLDAFPEVIEKINQGGPDISKPKSFPPSEQVLPIDAVLRKVVSHIGFGSHIQPAANHRFLFRMDYSSHNILFTREALERVARSRHPLITLEMIVGHEICHLVMDLYYIQYAWRVKLIQASAPMIIVGEFPYDGDPFFEMMGGNMAMDLFYEHANKDICSIAFMKDHYPKDILLEAAEDMLTVPLNSPQWLRTERLRQLKSDRDRESILEAIFRYASIRKSLSF